jgi:hypothetical protein
MLRNPRSAPVTRTLTALLFGLFVQASTAAALQEPKVNHDAQVLLDFKNHLDQYVELRKKADDTALPLKKTNEPSEIHAAQLELAERIGVARKEAKRGDIFTPEIAAHIKRLMRPELKEKGTKAEAKDEEDLPTTITFKVNGQYPPKEPLSTVPPNVLAALPPLPKDVEYRFVGKHLILRDVRANLVIDYIVNAMP